MPFSQGKAEIIRGNVDTLHNEILALRSKVQQLEQTLKAANSKEKHLQKSFASVVSGVPDVNKRAFDPSRTICIYPKDNSTGLKSSSATEQFVKQIKLPNVKFGIDSTRHR